MKWKYITNIDKNRNFAEMFIYDEVCDDKVNGTNFAYELRYLLTYEDIKEVKVRVNSIGGSVVHGFSIISAIINAKKDYPHVSVNTYNDGVAASIAWAIFCCGKTRFMKDYARCMAHGVALTDADMSNLSENDRLGLENLGDMIIEAVSASTGCDKRQIEALLSNGKDNWFNAEESVEAGFIAAENIEYTGQRIILEEKQFSALAVQNKASEIINNLTQIPMKKVYAKLALTDSASEDATVASIEKIENRATTAENALEKSTAALQKATNEATELKGKLDAANKTAALAVVKNAIKEKGFDPTKEAELLVQAETNLEAFTNMIALLPTKANNIGNFIDKQGSEKETETLIAKVANRTFRDLEKKDASLLLEIKNSAKPLYVELYNKQYGTAKTEADF